jgi:RND family efflux transporter MFP subunit
MTHARKLHLCVQPVMLMLAWFAVEAFAMDVPELDCVIEPHMVIDLSSRTDGIVESVQVERGDLVEEGQVVVLLEAGVERAAVAYARAAAVADADLRAGEVSTAFAQRRRGRLESLYREQALSSDQMDEMDTEALLKKLQLDQSRERKRLAQLELRQALEVLERHTIRSPVSGVVVQLYLAPGESVEEKPIMRLAQIDPLRVEVIVPVSYFGSINAGQQAIVMPERPKPGEYAAEVTVVDRVADAASGTFRVRLSVPNPDYGLPSGLKCMVRFLPDTVSPPMTVAQVQPPAVPDEPALSDVAEANPIIAIPHSGLSRSLRMSAQPPAEPAAMAIQRDAARALREQPADQRSKNTVTKPARAAVPQRLGVCQTVGPIEDKFRANKVKAALMSHADRIAIREKTQSKPEGFIIVSLRHESTREAAALAARMREAGLTDVFVFGHGPYKGRVSLGLYNSRSWAENRLKTIASAGFDAEIMARSRDVTRYWVDLEGGTPVGVDQLNLPFETRELLTNLNVAPAPCEPLLAAGN